MSAYCLYWNFFFVFCGYCLVHLFFQIEKKLSVSVLLIIAIVAVSTFASFAHFLFFFFIFYSIHIFFVNNFFFSSTIPSYCRCIYFCLFHCFQFHGVSELRVVKWDEVKDEKKKLTYSRETAKRHVQRREIPTMFAIIFFF